MKQTPPALSADEDERLRRDFPRWRVWRAKRPDGTPGMWMANPPPERTDLTPTLMAETADGLRVQMAAPGPRYGRPVPQQAGPQ
ncbi:hypothetical protein [Nocardiopsis halophila]|uniref:hypothetical protein n=1 Tax=Nocardiopsis halophila TaxID=141692 RepID=UPI0003733B35|nr:hypothetical protein [Nocardiopsis halophila]